MSAFSIDGHDNVIANWTQANADLITPHIRDAVEAAVSNDQSIWVLSGNGHKVAKCTKKRFDV